MDVADDGERAAVAGRARRWAGHPENDEGAQADEEGCRSCHAEGGPLDCAHERGNLPPSRPPATTRPTCRPTTSRRPAARRPNPRSRSRTACRRSPGRCSPPSASTPTRTTSRSSAWPSRSASASSCRAACSTRTASPCPKALVEIWQCNAAGRYHHPGDQHDAPLDPNFYGGGRVRADANGQYKFITIKPGAYPWKNHHNAWRPAHIHFSLFGPAFATRLITQMYFPNDPLLAHDPIYNSVPAAARASACRRRSRWT